MILTEGPNAGPVFVLGDFDDNMEASLPLALISEIKRQMGIRVEDRCIDIYINSFGGYRHLVFQLASLVNLAKREDIVVRTIVPDIAYSAGSILACTGTEGERYIERTAEHLLHYGFTASGEETPEQVERNHLQKIQGFKKIRNHYLANSRVSPDDLDALMSDDSGYVPASKAIKWGLADRYMEKFDISRTFTHNN